MDEAREAPAVGFWADLRDAVEPRTIGLIVGVLCLQLGFILSYVGAFHDPRPHRITLDVVAPAQVSGQTVARLDAIPKEPVRAWVATDEAAARRDLSRAASSGALIVNPSGTEDTLLVASAGGASTATALEEVVTQAETANQRSVRVQDAVPLQAGDARGLTGFYLVIGWIVGGYLVAALLGVAKGTRPATVRRAVFRLGALVPYAVLSGLGGAIIVGPVLGALTGHTVALWWIGALLVMAAGAVTMAFEVMFGVIGIGLTVLVFVILGNPTAGGAYQPGVLPAFWRALTDALPNGAGTDAVRRVVYFGATGVAMPLIVVSAYVVGGVAVTLLASAFRSTESTTMQTQRASAKSQ